jgi:hypothetical protein
MKRIACVIFTAGFYFFSHGAYCQGQDLKSVSVPIILDHNRMIVDAEIQRKDGSWRKVRLWVDSGNPDFFMNESLARDIGIDLSTVENSTSRNADIDVPSPSGIRIGGKRLRFNDVRSKVVFQPFWLFSTMHNDANLPSTVLKQYHIIFDYPKRLFTIAEPGRYKPHGIPSPMRVHPKTGIIQMDALIGGDSISFALDNGASYSFISETRLMKFSDAHPEWPHMTGTLGCANMWGWWPPNEQLFPVVRIPKMRWGQQQLEGVGIVGVPKFSPNGPTIGEWYSQKTARPVDGFLGANVFKAFRIEIDFVNSLIYFEKSGSIDMQDMDMVGLSIRQLADSSYQIVGLTKKDGKTFIQGVEPGDILFSVGDLEVKGLTMGKVVDTLRGKPGDIHVLTIERNGKRFRINAKVEHFL